MTGSGTSGRIAAYCSRYFGPQWKYLISGGDAALTKSVENAEDDPLLGGMDLARISEGASRVVLIGITCGMSAPYVAGMLDYAMNNGLWKFLPPILIGFNPVEAARDVPIEGWSPGKTFRSVAQRLQGLRGGFVINPVIGPEPITGSTRMKGGTATKVLLEVLRYGYADYVDRLRASVKAAYANEQALAQMIERCGQALLAGNSIHYVSEDEKWGMLGRIDASECPPTYGALPSDVVGHLPGEEYTADPGNVTIGLATATKKPGCDFILECPPSDTLALKLQLNVISSGAHVVKGKIFGNRMIDLRLANNKLVQRANGIVCAILECDTKTSQKLLLEAIYGPDWVLHVDDAVSAHVSAAMTRPRIIPTAVLLGRGRTLEQANAILTRQPILRLALEEQVEQKK